MNISILVVCVFVYLNNAISQNIVCILLIKDHYFGPQCDAVHPVQDQLNNAQLHVRTVDLTLQPVFLLSLLCVCTVLSGPAEISHCIYYYIH